MTPSNYAAIAIHAAKSYKSSGTFGSMRDIIKDVPVGLFLMAMQFEHRRKSSSPTDAKTELLKKDTISKSDNTTATDTTW